MTIEQFWHEDCDLMYCYIQAYYARLHKQGWVSGTYVHQAVGSALAEMMPTVIQRGLGMIKDKKLIKSLNEIKYFDRPIPDLIVESNTRTQISDLSEDDLMELDRRISEKFK